MPLQFICPFCQASQLVLDQAQGQSFACAKCRRVVKIAAPPAGGKQAAPAAVPLARPVSPAATLAWAGRAGRCRSGSNIAIYVVAGVVALTMLTGVALAIFFWPGREQTRPQSKAPAQADKAQSEKEVSKPAPAKKVEPPPPEPEPDLDVEPPPPLLARTMSEWYVDGAGSKVRLDFIGLDPAAPVKELKVVVWTGEVGAPKPASWRSPRVRPGDDVRQEVAVPYQEGRGTVEVPLPPLPKDKVYWLQPMLVDAAGKQQWLAVEPWEPAAPPLERRPALLAHKIEASQRKIHLNTQATVTVRDVTGKPYVFNIGVRADADEQLKADADAASLQVRWVRVQFDFAQDGIPALVEKVLGAALDAAPKIKSTWRLDPAGTVSKRTVSLDDVPAAVRKEVAEFDERLAQALDLLSLHLPNRELKALESWSHQRLWNKTTLDLTATYEGRRSHQMRDEAYLSVRGTCKGAGNSKDGKVEGTALVDLRTGFVMKAELKVETEIVVPFISREEVRGPGVLEVKLTRELMK